MIKNLPSMHEALGSVPSTSDREGSQRHPGTGNTPLPHPTPTHKCCLWRLGTGAQRRDTAGLLMTKQATFPSVYLRSHQSNFPDTLLCPFFSILVSTPPHFLWELWTLPVILSEGFPWLLKYKHPMYQRDVPCETRARICRDIQLII